MYVLGCTIHYGALPLCVASLDVKLDAAELECSLEAGILCTERRSGGSTLGRHVG